MKKSILLITIAFALSSCDSSKQNDASHAADTVDKTPVEKQVEVAKITLTSGIDLQYVDETVRPQDDFYRHVNGKWLKEYVMPADKSRFGAFNLSLIHI